MKITQGNFNYDSKKIEQKIKKISKLEEPEFARYIPDTPFFKKTLNKYKKYSNVIVIGHGGSITTTQGFYGALKKENKKLYIIDSPEPDFIDGIKRSCKKKDSVVVVVSKSGTTVDILEIMMEFLEYQMIIITNPEDGTLLEVSKSIKAQMIEHPNLGGRFSGFSSSALVPCCILGMDIDRLCKGAMDMYKKCSFNKGIRENPALNIAVSLYLADNNGKNEIFAPVYSKKMLEFSNLLIQLLHESSCKEGKGQTIYVSSAPESQHHTNQRFFGGKDNVCGLFITTSPKIQKKDGFINIPLKLRNIVLRDGLLGDLRLNKYSEVLLFEYLGVLSHAKKAKVPHIEIMIEKCDEYELGEFVALWHYIAVYASLLRDVNPFDQPEVEYSKNISFDMRKKKAR
jgi:glucose-6-phosphate isomerase